MSADTNGSVCMTPECGGKALWKGLCRSCYGQARTILDSDSVTWDQLEAMGLCKQDHKPFRAAYLAAKAKKGASDDH